MKTIKIYVTVFLLIGMLVTIHGGARFTDNGDGTITDNGTGLLWQKCSYGQSVPNCSESATTMDWGSALQICRNSTLASRSWRLPNINELGSIVDYSSANPSINLKVFPNPGAGYWTSSTVISSSANAWSVVFAFGIVGYGAKDDRIGCVRCVADGP